VLVGDACFKPPIIISVFQPFFLIERKIVLVGDACSKPPIIISVFPPSLL